MELESKHLNLSELKLEDLVMSGEASRICQVDRRTFLRRVDRGDIKVYATIEGKAVFKRNEVEWLAKKIKAERDKD